MRQVSMVCGLALMAAGVACGPGLIRVRPTNDTCDSVSLEECEKRCDGDVARACYRLGWFRETGYDGELEQNQKEAIALYKKACDLGFVQACWAAGQLYWEPGWKGRDAKKAVAFLDKACGMGMTGACPTEEQRAEAEGRKPKSEFELRLEAAGKSSSKSEDGEAEASASGGFSFGDAEEAAGKGAEGAQQGADVKGAVDGGK